MNRFPNFGREVRRSFAVHEDCYDCAEFYQGCKGRPSSQAGRCGDWLRLPDVMPGTTGQRIPPSRGRTEPRVRRALTPDHQEPTLASAPAPDRKRPKPKDLNRAPSPAAGYGPDGKRLCECGATLPKGKRLCDTCRTKNRRQTKTGYMRGYMQQRRSGVSEPLSGVPPARAGSCLQRASAEERPSGGHLAGGPLQSQTSVLTNPTCGGDQL